MIIIPTILTNLLFQFFSPLIFRNSQQKVNSISINFWNKIKVDQFLPKFSFIQFVTKINYWTIFGKTQFWSIYANKIKKTFHDFVVIFFYLCSQFMAFKPHSVASTNNFFFFSISPKKFYIFVCIFTNVENMSGSYAYDNIFLCSGENYNIKATSFDTDTRFYEIPATLYIIL